ncbi:putative glucan endo-1,3-beta-glucosidase A-like [Capsicum annuum]|nr:putative glucan endo-1,3-beta-glucosidase A-like [Capsicum annuum]
MLFSLGQRADTSTNWREFTSPEGRKYYYNKVTRTSKWRMPDEVKVIWIVKRTPFRTFLIFGSISVVKTLSPDVDGSLVSAHGAKSSSTTVSPAANLPTIVASESSSLYGKVSSPMIEIVEIKNSSEPASPGDTNSEKIGIAVTLGNSVAPPIFETTTTQDAVVYGDRFSSENREAMRAVINDRRYGALKSLSEPKQAFNDVSLQVGIGMGKMTIESQMMDATTSMGENNIATSSCTNALPTMAPAEKPGKFSGIDFKRWNYILSGLQDDLYNVSSGTKTSKELWGPLEPKYKMEDELQVIIHDLLAEGIIVNDAFQVAAIVEKLPPLWKDFKNYLKHKCKEMTLEDLIVRLRIEEDNKAT